MAFCKHIFLSLIFLPSLCIASNTFSIATGDKEGSYYPVGKAISEIIGNKGRIEIKVIESAGSDENIVKLINNEVDLAIVQADILHKFKFSNKGDEYYKYKDKSESIKTIIALFPEFVQILVRTEDDILNIFKLDGEEIYIGKENSGTRLNAIDILDFFNIEYSQEVGGEITSFSDAISALKDNRIRAVFYTSGVINKDPDLRILPIDSSLAVQLIKKFPYYVHKNIDVGKGVNIGLFTTRAVLIALENSNNKRLGKSDANYIAKEIFENQYYLEKSVDKNLLFFRGDSMVRKVSQNLHVGAEEYFRNKNITANTGLTLSIIIAVLSFLMIIIVFHQWPNELKLVFIRIARWLKELNLFKKTNLKELLVILKNWLLEILTNSAWRIAIITFFLVLSIGIAIILYYEQKYSNLHDVDNPFSGKGLWDILYWITTFGITGFNQDIYPNSLQAKIAAIAIPVFAVFGAIFTMMFGFFQKSHRLDKEQRGLCLPKLNNHVVICGWNNRVPELIREITSDSAPRRDTRVVVIAEIDEEKPLEKYNFRKGTVYYMRGISSDYSNLTKANIVSSIAAIIVADSKKIARGNLRGVFTCIAIRSLTKKLPDEYTVVSELYFPENKTYFMESGITKLVCLKEVPIRLISHACINPGISNLIIDLLSFGPPYQTKLESLSDLHPRLSNTIEGLKYSEAIRVLRKEGFLLLALYRENKKLENSPLELEFREQNSPYIINPDTDGSIILKDDQLLLVKPIIKGKKILGCSKFIKQESYRTFDKDNECLMIIGEEDVCRPLIKVLHTMCRRIIYIALCRDDNPTSFIEYSNIEVIRTNKIDVEFAVLNQSNLKLVTRVIVPAQKYRKSNELGIYQDDYTMMLVKSILYIYKNCECIRREEEIHILAEMKNENNLSLFHDIGISQPVPTNLFIDRILAQMVFHSGVVSEFFLKTMSLTAHNTKARLVKLSTSQMTEIVGLDVTGKTYDEILEVSINARAQLLAIEKHHSRDIILNPPQQSKDSEYSLLENDFLYVFLSGNDGIACEMPNKAN